MQGNLYLVYVHMMRPSPYLVATLHMGELTVGYREERGTRTSRNPAMKLVGKLFSPRKFSSLK